MGFYVTVIRGKRVGWLAGPFFVHEDALQKVDECRRVACEIDPWCAFDAFGTASTDAPRRGVLNEKIGFCVTKAASE